MLPDIMRPAWLDRAEHPFAIRTFHGADGRQHYVDEGTGPVLLFVHGTPDWSFGFRQLIKAFAATHRCVAMDHLGFGLSDKPAHADYTVPAHARRLQAFIDHLGLHQVNLVVTDFGGSIGLQHALEHPDNVKSIVLYNTWMWDLMPDKRFSRPSAIMNSWLGRLLYLRFGFSVNVMMPSGYGDRGKLAKALHEHFKKALPGPASRTATFACVQEISDAGQFWDAQWNKVPRLSGIPVLLCWGMRDRFFPPDLLQRWKAALPHAVIHEFKEVGHIVHEEGHEELSSAMRSFLQLSRS
jgi:pimeloyl-ACP methyl ester carboxylesterase